jgi:hypothetical protein
MLLSAVYFIMSRPLSFIFPFAVLYFPVRCPRCFRPLSYIFFFAVYFPVRYPIHIFRPLSFIFPSAVLYFPVRFPRCSRPLSYIPVRCPLSSVCCHFAFMSAVLYCSVYAPIRHSVFSYSSPSQVLFAILYVPICYCPRSYKFLTLFRVSLYEWSYMVLSVVPSMCHRT